jgi:hypothetical protein
MSEKTQGLIFIASLIGVLVMIYRGKMAYEKPKGICLVAGRLASWGAGILFAAIGGVIVWGDQTGMEEILIVPIVIGILLTFSGILMWLTNSCGKTK